MGGINILLFELLECSLIQNSETLHFYQEFLLDGGGYRKDSDLFFCDKFYIFTRR